MMTTRGIVLSGGGARGAYEVGIVAGILEALGEADTGGRIFDVFTGTSVGAINAAWLAASAHRPDLDIDGLIAQWRSLRVRRHLKLDPMGMLAGRRLRPVLNRLLREPVARLGRSLFDPRALEELVSCAIDYEQLHRNVDAGIVRACVVASLRIEDGATAMFADVAPGARFHASRDPQRVAHPTRIRPKHVLASSAIPLVFPAREIDGHYYCDGGLRFNTPIAPALRSGANKLVVVSLKHAGGDAPLKRSEVERCYPNPLFLLGKVLDALLLDPMDYDLQVLERFNRMLETLEDALSEDEMEEFQKVIEETRGVRYRSVETLVFRPSEDIGKMAARRAREIRQKSLTTLLFAGTGDEGEEFQADLLSFILFDGEFAERLVELGRRDALARAREIRRFFDADR